MLGLYFSGTGNSRHCVEKFVSYTGENDNDVISIENPNVDKFISGNNFIVLGYPIYFSNIPKIVRDFIDIKGNLFKGKRIFVIATMGLFSGDGSGCSARLLKKYGAKIIGGLHLKMPDCIGDEKLLKKSTEQNKELVKKAELKIKAAVQRVKDDYPTQEGLNIFYHIAGLFGQRLWFYNKTTEYKKKPDVDKNKCIGCGLCEKLCPMNNIYILDQKAVSGGKCTLCYRCFSECPTQALTILGKKVHEQCRLEKYI